jgi:hypothetical protein
VGAGLDGAVVERPWRRHRSPSGDVAIGYLAHTDVDVELT